MGATILLSSPLSVNSVYRFEILWVDKRKSEVQEEGSSLLKAVDLTHAGTMFIWMTSTHT